MSYLEIWRSMAVSVIASRGLTGKQTNCFSSSWYDDNHTLLILKGCVYCNTCIKGSFQHESLLVTDEPTGEAFLLRSLPRPAARDVFEGNGEPRRRRPSTNLSWLSFSLLCRLERFRPLNKASFLAFCGFQMCHLFLCKALGLLLSPTKVFLTWKIRVKRLDLE